VPNKEFFEKNYEQNNTFNTKMKDKLFKQSTVEYETYKNAFKFKRKFDELINGFINSKSNPEEFRAWLLKRDINHITEELKEKIRNTKNFIECLRIEMEKVVPLNYLDKDGHLTLVNMSKFLDGRKDFISSIILRKANHDLTYRLALDVIIKWKTRLIELGIMSRNSIDLLMAYLEFHKPVIPISYHISWSQYRSQKFIKEDFFNKIDTIEKAYWLGFFFGDGSVTYSHNKLRKIVITLKADSQDLLSQLCGSLGLHPTSIFGPYTHRHKDGRVNMEVQLSINSEEMVNDIIKAGFTPPMRGSHIKKIKWPLHLLITKKLKLAFILGFYDAEGRTGSTQIRQTDREFLDIVVSEFNLPFEPKFDEYGWSLTLGGHLLNLAQRTVLENTRLRGIVEKRKLFQHHGPTEGFIRTITKDRLRSLVDQMPVPSIAYKFSVNSSVVYQTMRKWKIKGKPRGFWHTKEQKNKKN